MYSIRRHGIYSTVHKSYGQTPFPFNFATAWKREARTFFKTSPFVQDEKKTVLVWKTARLSKYKKYFFVCVCERENYIFRHLSFPHLMLQCKTAKRVCDCLLTTYF